MDSAIQRFWWNP
jgi:hypothetical protein